MNNQEKKKSYPFKKIAIAIGFTPRIEAILAESSRLQKLLMAQLIFIHIGDKTLQQEQYLKHLLHRFGLDGNSNNVIWEQGDPVDQIIAICEKEEVDLLIAGALEKESMLKYILGGIARNLCRKAKCSVLMLREPNIKSMPIKRIVVEGSDHLKTENTIETAIYIAKTMKAEQLYVVQEEDAGKMAVIRSEDNNDSRKEQVIIEEVNKLNDILACTDCGNMQLITERIEGKPGYVITKFAREHNADLLVLNSPDMSLNILDRVFPHDIEFALADLPCDLLIVNAPQLSTQN
ncbi:MAG: universal stress protein [Bacteroidia bacterium]|jgi:nucleotide-binding universal stress UspA family protein|nr:universal stress protein [Bacteroidia bacterium]MBP9689714.1 universal stress protein [Bacteroidia bacterium]